jgi:hypothetical protein
MYPTPEQSNVSDQARTRPSLPALQPHPYRWSLAWALPASSHGAAVHREPTRLLPLRPRAPAARTGHAPRRCRPLPALHAPPSPRLPAPLRDRLAARRLGRAPRATHRSHHRARLRGSVARFAHRAEHPIGDRPQVGAVGLDSFREPAVFVNRSHFSSRTVIAVTERTPVDVTTTWGVLDDRRHQEVQPPVEDLAKAK